MHRGIVEMASTSRIQSGEEEFGKTMSYRKESERERERERTRENCGGMK